MKIALILFRWVSASARDPLAFVEASALRLRPITRVGGYPMCCR